MSDKPIAVLETELSRLKVSHRMTKADLDAANTCIAGLNKMVTTLMTALRQIENRVDNGGSYAMGDQIKQLVRGALDKCGTKEPA